jgi:nucleoside-diphosphate-sugar epimerase
MTQKRIFFTGGSGKAGKHVISHLLGQGHRVMNVDLVPSEHPGVDHLIADITDSGQIFNAMSSYAGLDELEWGNGVPKFDAVVHFAAVPRILIKPDNETFRVNTMGTYHVIEAAVKLGIKKIIIASSETTYGICFSDGKTAPHALPLEEDYDVDPMDSYGLSKVVNEKTARSFQRRSGFDIYVLRIGNVIEPHEYAELFPYYFKNPEVRRRNAFCYIDARDLGQIVDLCLK